MSIQLNHILIETEPAYEPRLRAGRGSNLAGPGGYYADDPPEEARWACSCGWEGAASECRDGMECPSAQCGR